MSDNAIHSYELFFMKNTQYDSAGYPYERIQLQSVQSVNIKYQMPKMYYYEIIDSYNHNDVHSYHYEEELYYDGETSYIKALNQSKFDHEEVYSGAHEVNIMRPGLSLQFIDHPLMLAYYIEGLPVNQYLKQEKVFFKKQDVYNDIQCDVFTYEDVNKKVTVWLATEMMYRPIRFYAVLQHNGVTYTTDISTSYANIQNIYLPVNIELKGYTSAMYNEKTVYEVSYEKVNSVIENNFFEIPFDEGVKVFDHTSGEEQVYTYKE
jgi:hypothetical protein